jgi:hypothetical protein
LLPATLGPIAGDLKEGAPSVAVVTQRFENPALELFNDPRNGNLSDSAIKIWFKLQETSNAADIVTLARLESGDPFLVEKPFGEGRVIVCCHRRRCGLEQSADASVLPAAIAAPFGLPRFDSLSAAQPRSRPAHRRVSTGGGCWKEGDHHESGKPRLRCDGGKEG